MDAKTSNTFLNKRLIAVLALAFSSGLPLALTGSTLQAWFTEAQVNLVSIGMLSLLGIPYTLKFLWAPLMDQYSPPFLSKLGKRRGWTALMQFSMMITLILFANLNPATDAYQMGIIALIIAFFSASQDISVDAYRTDILGTSERGLGSAYTIFAYRLALLLAGGLALVSADYVGWKVTYEIMAALLGICLLATLKAPMPLEVLPASKNLLTTIYASLADLLQREKIILLLLFVIFYKLGDALALSLMTNFLLHGLGFSLTEVGLAYKAVSIIATIMGAFVGGILLTRWNLYWALLVFALAQAFSNLMFVVLAIAGKNFLLMTVSLFIENFCSGLSTAAFMAFLMSICNHHYTASQYALLSAIASLGRVFLGPVAGLLVENIGWVQFYIWSFVMCFPGIILLMLLKNKVTDYAHAAIN